MNPILIEVFRGDTRESFHRGSVVAVNAAGEKIFELGNSDAVIFPRSALKPVQAIPLLESGAADHFKLTAQELALSCASHNAQAAHQAVLDGWLNKIGLEEGQLECGASLPLHEATAHQWLRDGGEPMRRLHNCSGKHTGMLTLSRYLDVPTKDYSSYEHETQQRWMRVLSDLSGQEARDLPWDRDGCGLPAVALPLIDFARVLGSFCNTQQHSEKRARAMAAILAAMHEHADMVAGDGRCCTATMKSHKDLVVKTGAEGVFAAIAPSQGVAIALKMDDGATRAADAALGAVLRKLNIITDHDYQAQAQWYSPEIVNSQAVVVGKLSAAKVWQA